MNVLLPKKMDLTYKVKFIDPHSFIIKYFIYIKKKQHITTIYGVEKGAWVHV